MSVLPDTHVLLTDYHRTYVHAAQAVADVECTLGEDDELGRRSLRYESCDWVKGAVTALQSLPPTTTSATAVGIATHTLLSACCNDTVMCVRFRYDPPHHLYTARSMRQWRNPNKSSI